MKLSAVRAIPGCNITRLKAAPDPGRWVPVCGEHVTLSRGDEDLPAFVARVSRVFTVKVYHEDGNHTHHRAYLRYLSPRDPQKCECHLCVKWRAEQAAQAKKPRGKRRSA